MAAPIYKGGPPFFKPYLRFPNAIGFPFQTAGAPVNGTSGSFAGKAGLGSILIDNTTGNVYQNSNTKASPTWVVLNVPGQSTSVLGNRIEKTAVLALNGTTIHAGPVGIVNPEGVDVVVNGVAVAFTTHATAAGGLVDVGWTSVSISTASDNILDGLACGSAITVPIAYVNTQAGANGKFGTYWTAGTWITVSDDATASVAGMIGNLYISYVLA